MPATTDRRFVLTVKMQLGFGFCADRSAAAIEWKFKTNKRNHESLVRRNLDNILSVIVCYGVCRSTLVAVKSQVISWYGSDESSAACLIFCSKE